MEEQTQAPKPAPATLKSSGISKVEAVGQAMGKLGKNASRADLQAYLKQHLGFHMSPSHISNCKTKFLRSKAKKGKKAVKPKKVEVVKAAAHETVAPKPVAKKPKAKKTAAPKHSAASNGKAAAAGLSLQDVQKTRDLLGRVGAAQLRSLIDLLAR